MIAALIFVVSAAALLQFFVSYCRSVVAAYGKQEISLQEFIREGDVEKIICNRLHEILSK